MFKKSLFFGAGIASMLYGMSAYAQGANEERDAVITTATKRTQTLLQTPFAISVTDALTIEQAKILDLNDLQSVVPSLRVNQLQSTQNVNFIIRGFGNGANNAGIESSVGVFVDGIYRSRSAARVTNLPKLNQVEVLRGPQSTLFGKNASAGVISIVTAKPTYEYSGYAEATYGNYDNYLFRAYLTGGVTDTLAVSLGGSYNNRDGYFESADGILDNANDRNRWNLRAQALFEPTHNTSFRLIADYSSLDENCCGVTNVVASPTTGIIQNIFTAGGGAGLATAPITDPFSYQTYQNKDAINEIEDYGFSLEALINFEQFDLTSLTSWRSNDSFYDTDADYSRLNSLDAVTSDQQIDTFTQEVRLTSNDKNTLPFDWMLGGYLYIEDVLQVGGLEYGVDLRSYIDVLAGGPATLGGLELSLGAAPGTYFSGDVRTIETFTQDNTSFSFFGTVDYKLTDRFILTGGINYTNDAKDVTGSTINNDSFSNLSLGGADGIAVVSAGIFANGQAPIPVLLPSGIPSFMDTFGLIPTSDNILAVATNPASAAGFAAYNAGVTQFATAAVTGAANPLAGLFALQFQSQFLAFPNTVEDGRTRDNQITWQVQGAYSFTENVNVYGSVSTGFKASSWNLSRDSRPLLSDALALQTANLLPNNYNVTTGRNFGTRFAGPEDVIVYEIGLKTQFEKGFVNVAVFQQNIDGFQTNAFVGTLFVLTNAGELEVLGAEIDAQFEPFDGFVLNGSATFLDPEYRDFRNAPGPSGVGAIDRTGERPDNVSRTRFALGATYRHDFSENISAYVRGNWYYEGSTLSARNLAPDSLLQSAALNPLFGTITAVNDYENRSQSTVHASVGVDMANGLGVQVWARNLFNDRYFSTLFPGVAQFGIINAYPSPPRTYGISVRYNF